jgi:polysaccharide biosynthesis transport protein
MIESHNFEQRDAGIGWMINHLPTIVWQRRYYALTVFAAFLIVSVAAAFAFPTLYRSSATLLIESQELPTAVAESPGTGAIEQRIAKIRERVLSRGDLISLIEQYDLYASERRSQPLSKVIDKMRKATAVGALEGDIGSQPNTAPGQSNVIALNMTYDYPDPVKAQEVLQSYVQSFLRMDSDVVEDQAMLTVRFLQDQAQKLANQIQQIESEITALKARNGSALVQGGMPSMIDTGSYSAQIVDLENQNRQLLLQSRTGGKNQALAAAEAALTAARSQFSDSHPDVIAARERLRVLQQQAAQAPSSTNDAVQEQISANNQAIGLLRAQRDAALARANASIAGQARAPAILEQASQLEDRATQLREQYKKVSDDLLKAQNSARMAGEQRAERLSLVEPASLPDHPHWPNRPLVIGAGAAAGLVFGLLLALLMELLKRPVRSPVQLEGLGIPVVGIVPIIDRGPKKRRWWPFSRRQEAGLA